MKGKYTIPLILILIVLTSGIVLGAGEIIADFEGGDTSGWFSQADISAVEDANEAPEGSWYGEISDTNSIDFTDDQHTNVSFWGYNIEDSNVANIEDGNQGDSQFDDLVSLYIDNNHLTVSSTPTGTTNIDIAYDTWYHYKIQNITYQDEQYDLRVYNKSGGLVGSIDDVQFMEPVDSISRYSEVRNQISRIDHLVVGTFSQNIVDGRVVDRDQQGLNNVNISTNQTGIFTQTNGTGYYEGELVNGTYKITANKTGYAAESEIITLAGNSTTVNFRLLSESHRFKLEVNNWMDYNSKQEYKVTYIDITADNKLVPKIVTNQANVTSSNPTLVSVDTANNQLISTSNESKTGQVEITANYTNDDGDIFIARQNVTVAPRTIDNIDIMPPSQYLNTFLGIGEEGTVAGIGSQIQWLYLIIIFGVIVTVVSKNEWLGLGSMTIAIILFWVLGLVNVAIFIVALLFAIALGMTLIEVPKKQQVNIEAGTTQDDIEGYNDFE